MTHIKPNREDVAWAIYGQIVHAAQSGRIDIDVHDTVPGINFERSIADAVLALFNGKTEQEVRRAAYDDLIAELLSVTEDYVSIAALSGIVDGLLARGGDGQ